MPASLILVRYKPWLGWAGFLSMAIFRLPLLLSNQIAFWRLMGCGKNGTFDIMPDLLQWGLLLIPKENIQPVSPIVPSFIAGWWRFFGCEEYHIELSALEGHGTWNGKEVFGKYPENGSSYSGKIAVLTRATIRLRKLSAFWKQVDQVAETMTTASGFITSVGIGEIPWVKQATFSVWESREQMKQFAYRMREHQDVIRRTRQEKWYSEEMFVRFAIISTRGTLRGVDPISTT
ncbi:MAG: DUF3291 domain-containing protein [Chitinophagia bacterium]|jgi:hypothetical protein